MERTERASNLFKKQSIKDLFLNDISRVDKFTADACGIHLDFSKNLFTSDTLRLLIKLADTAHLKDQAKALFAGKRINTQKDLLYTPRFVIGPKSEY